MHDMYSVLEVDSNINDFDLIEKYKQLVEIYHPDNIVSGDIKKYRKITEAYNKIIEYRINYNNIDKEEIRNDKIKEYNFTNAPSVDTDNQFINHKVYMNETIKNSNIVFIDGFAQIVTGYKDNIENEISFGPQEDFLYNYIDQKGNFLFDDSESILFHYLGRNQFLNLYSEDIWFLISPGKEKKRIKINNDNYAMIYDKKKFISVIVEELNKKYSLLENGLKYKFDRGKIKDWREEYKTFSASNPKKLIETFVNTICENDDMGKLSYKIMPENLSKNINKIVYSK